MERCHGRKKDAEGSRYLSSSPGDGAAVEGSRYLFSSRGGGEAGCHSSSRGGGAAAEGSRYLFFSRGGGAAAEGASSCRWREQAGSVAGHSGSGAPSERADNTVGGGAGKRENRRWGEEDGSCDGGVKQCKERALAAPNCHKRILSPTIPKPFRLRTEKRAALKAGPKQLKEPEVVESTESAPEEGSEESKSAPEAGSEKSEYAPVQKVLSDSYLETIGTIQAPKFADLSVVSTLKGSNGDASSWFCSRHGCNQVHMQGVGSPTISKNLVLGV